MTKNATLTYEDKSYELPTVLGTEAETAVDISQLRAKSGLITLDSGFRIMFRDSAGVNSAQRRVY